MLRIKKPRFNIEYGNKLCRISDIFLFPKKGLCISLPHKGAETSLQELILDLQNGQEKRLPETTLVIALDDTGHEEFKDPKYPVFGIGGCAFLVRDYQRLIERPWNDLCERFLPNKSRPIHAADLGRLSAEQENAFEYFFKKFEFFRLAITTSVKSSKEVENNFIELVGNFLWLNICEIGRWAPCERIFIIFEESKRIEMKVLRSLMGQKVKQNGREIKVEYGLIPKAASIPALEIADVIIHTAGVQTRNRIAGAAEVTKRYANIFRSVDERLVSFKEVTRVVPN